MKGFVETPRSIVDLMVRKVFGQSEPTDGQRVLDPGCGRGEFIAGVLRWCDEHGRVPPEIVGIESNPEHAEFCRRRFADVSNVEVRCADFLQQTRERFDYVVGNPPYVAITALDEEERRRYRGTYQTAVGRFDLYTLFFEEALRRLNPSGRLVFITPEKFTYVDSARPLRRLLASQQVVELEYVSEATFGQLVTYPLITTVVCGPATSATLVVSRTGRTSRVRVSSDGQSWLGALNGQRPTVGPLLIDACERISCGVATGADGVFVLRCDAVPEELKPFAIPTLAGREIRGMKLPPIRDCMLVPYSADGALLPEDQLRTLGAYLSEPARSKRLRARTCAARKPWYAFHETPPVRQVLQPKLLCKDITSVPYFVPDHAGTILPRHSTYYVIPRQQERLDDLLDFLNSEPSRAWLQAHCQRAANGFLRMQSAVLKRLPIPESLLPSDGTHQQLVLQTA